MTTHTGHTPTDEEYKAAKECRTYQGFLDDLMTCHTPELKQFFEREKFKQRLAAADETMSHCSGMFGLERKAHDRQDK